MGHLKHLPQFHTKMADSSFVYSPRQIESVAYETSSVGRGEHLEWKRGCIILRRVCPLSLKAILSCVHWIILSKLKLIVIRCYRQVSLHCKQAERLEAGWTADWCGFSSRWSDGMRMGSDATLGANVADILCHGSIWCPLVICIYKPHIIASYRLLRLFPVSYILCLVQTIS